MCSVLVVAPADSTTRSPSPTRCGSCKQGWIIDPLDLARISPYLTEHVSRFGAYSTHETGITPEDYDIRLDVDFSVLEDDQAPTADRAVPSAVLPGPAPASSRAR